MSYTCSRCQRETEKLFPIGDAHESAQYSALIEVPYPCVDHVCIRCAREMIGISETDLVREERVDEQRSDFLLNTLKGGIAQAIVETIFLEFGYEVYPFGYESYFTNIIRSLRRPDPNIPVRTIRATPDLFVYDRELNDGFFLEVKASGTPDESSFWIPKSTLQKYIELWPEAVLIVYCIRSMNIYGQHVRNISVGDLRLELNEVTNTETYAINLMNDFETLPSLFRLIALPEYTEFHERIRRITAEFSDWARR